MFIIPTTNKLIFCTSIWNEKGVKTSNISSNALRSFINKNFGQLYIFYFLCAY